MNFKDIYELFDKIFDRQGLFSGVILVMLILFLWLLSFYLKQSIKSAAEESYTKTIQEFKKQLNRSLQTQIGLFFRDESIRNSLIITIGQKSFDRKIECWQLTQEMYFNYQKMWNFTEETDHEEFSNLDEKLNQQRIKIFNNTVYLGYELSGKLIQLNSLMRENLRNKRTELIYIGKAHEFNNRDVLQRTLTSAYDVEHKISDLLSQIEQWLITKLHSDQTIDKFEFTKEQLVKIKEERKKQFDAIT